MARILQVPRTRVFRQGRRLAVWSMLVVALGMLVACGGGDSPQQALGSCPALLAVDQPAIPQGVETPVTVRIPELERLTYSFDLDTAPRAESAAGGQVTATLDREASSPSEARIKVTAERAGDITLVLRVRTTLPMGNCDARATLAAVAPPSVPGTLTREAVEGALNGLAQQLELKLRGSRDITNLVPLVPVQALVAGPGGGALASPTIEVAGVSLPVQFSVQWGDLNGAAALTDAAGPAALDLRLLPRVVPVNSRGGQAAQAPITCTVRLSVVLPSQPTVEKSQELALDTPVSFGLELPRLLALYRAPDFGIKYPAWRLDGGKAGEGTEGGNVPADRNSGVVVYTGADDVVRPDVSAITNFSVPSNLRVLNEGGGLGTRLALITGRVPTVLGDGGLSQLPTGRALDALPAQVRDQITDLRALVEAVEELVKSYAAMAERTEEKFARITLLSEVRDLGNHDQGALITSGGPPGAVVQDEVEAAIFIGPPRTSAELFVLGEFDRSINHPTGRDGGVGVLRGGNDGYVAVFPDLAAAGPSRESKFGWLPPRSDAYAEAHPSSRSDTYGVLEITTEIDQDRGLGSDEPLARTTVTENNRRENTLSRTLSSFRLLSE